jgi:hypothetical protein
MHIFLTSALGGGEWSASRPDRFTPGWRASSSHWIGGWADLRAGLHNAEKRKFLILQGLELWTLGRPARSQSLYRLRYPGSYHLCLLCLISTLCEGVNWMSLAQVRGQCGALVNTVENFWALRGGVISWPSELLAVGWLWIIQYPIFKNVIENTSCRCLAVIFFSSNFIQQC